MGQPLIEQLQVAGLPVVPFTTTAASKQLAVDALALAFERGSIAYHPRPDIDKPNYRHTRPIGCLAACCAMALRAGCMMTQ
jgi:hypothetical protein